MNFLKQVCTRQFWRESAVYMSFYIVLAILLWNVKEIHWYQWTAGAIVLAAVASSITNPDPSASQPPDSQSTGAASDLADSHSPGEGMPD